MVDYDQTNFYGKIKRENYDRFIIFHLIKSRNLTEDDVLGYKQEIKMEQQGLIRCMFYYITNIYPV
ncbi:hypothetical protein AL479_06295 [Citrobacter amalonaticus]|jgi:hypothetical protein|nr:hypothetical protein AL479_06295 [Citrobacter amalonaticus]